MAKNPFEDIGKTIGGGIAIPRFEPRPLPRLDIDPPAKWTHERIVRQINDFEQDLESGEEIGLRLVGTPGANVMHIEDVGYWGPDILIFHGTNEHDKPMQLIQHYTQVSILLTAVPAENDPPRRIGFHLVQRLEQPADE